MPVVTNAPQIVQIVAGELRKARGGQPLLDALAFTAASYGDRVRMDDATIDQLLSEVRQYFPEIRELEFASARLADVAPSSPPSPLFRLVSLKILAAKYPFGHAGSQSSATRGDYFASAIAAACPALESLDVYFGQDCEPDRLRAFLDSLDALANLRTLFVRGLCISVFPYGTATLAETYVDPNLVAATIVERTPSSLASLSLEFCPGPECDHSWETRTDVRMGLVKSIISAVARHPSRASRRPILRIRVRTCYIMSKIYLPSMWLDA